MTDRQYEKELPRCKCGHPLVLKNVGAGTYEWTCESCSAVLGVWLGRGKLDLGLRDNVL